MTPSRGEPASLVVADAGQGAVRATVTGRTLFRIPRPVRDFIIEGVAAAPGDRTFYLAGAVPVPDGTEKLEFFRVILAATGRPGPARRLPGAPVIVPFPISSNGLSTIAVAVSPDGRELAYAPDTQLYAQGDAGKYPPIITVQSVATGQRHTWSLWPESMAQISSLSWTAGDQLGFAALVGDAAVSNGTVVRDPRSELSVLMVLNPALPGASLMTDSRFVRYAATAVSASGDAPAPAGPQWGILSANGRSAYTLIRTPRGKYQLAVISLATGRMTRVLVSGPQAVVSDPLSVDGDNLLVPLNFRHLPHGKAYYISGHYVRIDVSTGAITPLPFPIYFSADAPLPPVELVW